ncbi:hypothetical protein R1flu_022439 [Riccia fluitans]|uniref:Uncharacterized protein n=1 Tax=Riccia fluitans TaxID=41844 RepID=A0ABD1XP60_9MARC
MDGAEARDLYPAITGDARQARSVGGHGGHGEASGTSPGEMASGADLGGPSGHQSVAHLAASDAPPMGPENPEESSTLAPGRTHNRIRSPGEQPVVDGTMQVRKSAKWIRNFGRIGSERRACIQAPVGCRRSAQAARTARADCRMPVGEGHRMHPGGPKTPRRLPRRRTADSKLVQTRESDYLIKTKHRDGPRDVDAM